MDNRHKKDFINLLFRFVMSLLQSAESRLGPLASWPSNILNYLFFDPPTYRIVMRLINFFYGNRVPCCLGVQLFHAYNDTDAFMTDDFYLFYNGYRRNTDSVHMGIYFHMWHEKFLFINGSNKNQLEIVEFKDRDISRGFRGLRDEETIALRNKIANVPCY